MGSILSTKGRYNRLQWWMTQLAIIALFALAMFLLVGSLNTEAIEERQISGSAIAALFVVFSVTFWLNLSACIKRYHDRGKSGWWFLIVMVPVIGPIWQLVELGFLSGDTGYNQFDVDDSFEPAAPAFSRAQQTSQSNVTAAAKPAQNTSANVLRPSYGQKPSFGQRM